MTIAGVGGRCSWTGEAEGVVRDLWPPEEKVGKDTAPWLATGWKSRRRGLRPAGPQDAPGPESTSRRSRFTSFSRSLRAALRARANEADPPLKISCCQL